MRHWTLDMGYRTWNIRHWTQDIRHPTVIQEMGQKNRTKKIGQQVDKKNWPKI